MPIHECTDNISTHSPDDVFKVLTLFEMLPEDQRFTLELDGDRLTAGVTVGVRFELGGHNHRIDGSVTEYQQAERVAITGKSRIGKAAVWLDLAPDKELGGTKVVYGFAINTPLHYRPMGHLVMEHLKKTMSSYAEVYIQNTRSGLENNRHITAYEYHDDPYISDSKGTANSLPLHPV
jgi:hypothetical protein